MCGKLNYSMYGTRDAGQCFDAHVEACMTKLGFTIGVFSTCVYYCAEKSAVCVCALWCVYVHVFLCVRPIAAEAACDTLSLP